MFETKRHKGWDRTPQITALAELMLDGYYRTIEGFCVLIQKEWCSFGHKFQDRCGGNLGQNETSPVFLQFLDCVYQFMAQNPTIFEFEESLLHCFVTHSYSNWFTTFSGNNEQERKHVITSNSSLWTYIERHQNDFINALYDGGHARGGGIEVGKETEEEKKEDNDGNPDESTSEETKDTTITKEQIRTNRTIQMNCEAIGFWQNLFRGGVMPFDGGNLIKTVSIQTNEYGVQRWNPNLKNIKRVLQSGWSKGNTTPATTSTTTHKSKKTRRTSIVDILKDLDTTATTEKDHSNGSKNDGGHSLEISNDDEYLGDYYTPPKKGCCAMM